MVIAETVFSPQPDCDYLSPSSRAFVLLLQTVLGNTLVQDQQLTAQMGSSIYESAEIRHSREILWTSTINQANLALLTFKLLSTDRTPVLEHPDIGQYYISPTGALVALDFIRTLTQDEDNYIRDFEDLTIKKRSASLLSLFRELGLSDHSIYKDFDSIFELIIRIFENGLLIEDLAIIAAVTTVGMDLIYKSKQPIISTIIETSVADNARGNGFELMRTAGINLLPILTLLGFYLPITQRLTDSINLISHDESLFDDFFPHLIRRNAKSRNIYSSLERHLGYDSLIARLALLQNRFPNISVFQYRIKSLSHIADKVFERGRMVPTRDFLATMFDYFNQIFNNPKSYPLSGERENLKAWNSTLDGQTLDIIGITFSDDDETIFEYNDHDLQAFLDSVYETSKGKYKVIGVHKIVPENQDKHPLQAKLINLKVMVFNHNNKPTHVEEWRFISSIHRPSEAAVHYMYDLGIDDPKLISQKAVQFSILVNAGLSPVAAIRIIQSSNLYQAEDSFKIVRQFIDEKNWSGLEEYLRTQDVVIDKTDQSQILNDSDYIISTLEVRLAYKALEKLGELLAAIKSCESSIHILREFSHGMSSNQADQTTDHIATLVSSLKGVNGQTKKAKSQKKTNPRERRRSYGP